MISFAFNPERDHTLETRHINFWSSSPRVDIPIHDSCTSITNKKFALRALYTLNNILRGDLDPSTIFRHKRNINRGVNLIRCYHCAILADEICLDKLALLLAKQMVRYVNSWGISSSNGPRANGLPYIKRFSTAAKICCFVSRKLSIHPGDVGAFAVMDLVKFYTSVFLVCSFEHKHNFKYYHQNYLKHIVPLPHDFYQTILEPAIERQNQSDLKVLKRYSPYPKKGAIARRPVRHTRN